LAEDLFGDPHDENVQRIIEEIGRIF